MAALIRSLQFQFWKRQNNNIYPSNTEEHCTNNNIAAIQEANKEDCVGPCLQRLERLEKVFVELSNKPAKIPLEKEHLLTESLDRIKSVEFDLEKTKRVSFYLCVLLVEYEHSSYNYNDSCRIAFTSVLLLQALHATVVKQLEIGELLEKLRESQCQVSSF